MTQKLSLPTLVFGMSTIVLASHSWAIAELSDKENYARNKNSVVFLEVSTADKTGKKDGWTGSGFIVSQEGHVLTNAHVVPSTEDFDTVTIVGCAGTRFCAGTPMEVIKREQELDLALLKFRDIGKVWTPVQVGDPNQVSVSEEVIALGYPLEENITFAEGKIGSRDAQRGLWQTSTPLNPGNSGGPIFNKQGEVVAVVVGGNSKAQLINYLIPINYATNLLNLVGINLQGQISSTTNDIQLTRLEIESLLQGNRGNIERCIRPLKRCLYLDFKFGGYARESLNVDVFVNEETDIGDVEFLHPRLKLPRMFGVFPGREKLSVSYPEINKCIIDTIKGDLRTYYLEDGSSMIHRYITDWGAEQAAAFRKYAPDEPLVTHPASHYTLNILSSPSSADIYLEGVYKGQTNKKVNLELGTHKIVLKKHGYKDCRTIIDIPKRTVFSCTLEEK